jgi:hypothetical protein
MKLRVKRVFKYMLDNITTYTLLPGTYNVPKDVSEEVAVLAIQFGNAVRINPPFKKVAPENKVVKITENKAAKRYKDKGLRKSPKKRVSRKK